jgi:hypothetical protein
MATLCPTSRSASTTRGWVWFAAALPVAVSLLSSFFLSLSLSLFSLSHCLSRTRTHSLSSLAILCFVLSSLHTTYPLSRTGNAPPPPPSCGCAKLGWDLGYGSASVCAATACSGPVPFAVAQDFCQTTFGSEARLCTAHELLNDEARESGCGYDGQRIWSSTACSSGFIQAYGSAADSGKEGSERKARA